MPKNALDQIKATDPNVITQVVCADMRRPAFVVTDWSVRPLSNKGIINPDGLFLVEGHGRDKADPAPVSRPWRVVVKIKQIPERETTPDNLWYWKREVLWFQSGLWKEMPGPVRGPRCYRVAESDGVWQMWMEHIPDSSPAHWTIEHFRLAARALGRWNGRCFQQSFRPAVPWMTRDPWHGLLEFGNSVPGWQDYSSPFLQKAINAEDFNRVCRLLDDFEHYSAVMNGLPQVLSRGDNNRRNLMIGTAVDGQAEVVAIDWELVGIGPLGGELASLIGASMSVSEVEPDHLPELEAIVYPAYLAGLREEGWAGDPGQIRLAYTAWLALWLGAVGPAMLALWTAPENVETVHQQFGCEQEELARGWGKAIRFALGRADEAKRLMEK